MELKGWYDYRGDPSNTPSSVDIIYKVVAMKRSGHHALIECIINNMDGEIYYINNVGKGESQNLYKNKMKLIKNNGNKKIVFYNIEDYDPSNDFNINLLSTTTITINILRDPLNLFASRLNLSKKNSNYKNLNTTYTLYKKHFNLIENKNFLSILYTRWVNDEKYRNEIANSLSLKTSNSLDKLSIMGQNPPYNLTSSFNNKDKDI